MLTGYEPSILPTALKIRLLLYIVVFVFVMAETDIKWSVDRLDGTYWPVWKFQMTHLLRAKGIWGFVDETETLRAGATEQQTADFKKQQEKTFSTLALAISPAQLYLITSYDKPKPVWDALCEHFEKNTLANKLLLKNQYFQMEMKEGSSIETHMKEMKELADRLAALGAAVLEEDQVVTLLGSLPPSYQMLVTTLEARNELTLNYVQQSLVHEEKKQSSGSSSEKPGSHDAMYHSHKEQHKDRDGKRQRSTCQWKPKCFSCGQKRHFQRDCLSPKRKKEKLTKHNAKPVKESATVDSDTDESYNSIFTASSNQSPSEQWLIDSGATSHMTYSRELLHCYRKFDVPQTVSLGDGRTVEAIGAGDNELNMMFKVSKKKRCTMKNVLYVPKLTSNCRIVAVSMGNSIRFGVAKCWIKNNNENLIGMGILRNKLYILDCEPIEPQNASVASQEANTADLWHRRLGHLGKQQLKDLASKESLKGVTISKNDDLSFCESCVEGKMHRQPFQPSGDVCSTRKLQLVRSDVCGPMPTESLGKKRYFLDDYSRCNVARFTL